MAVKIRLARRGAKKRPFYDIVAIDSRKKRDGRPLERLGYIDPMLEKETEHSKKIVIDRQLIEKWLSNGAIPTETVARKLMSLGFKGMEEFVAPQKESVGVSRKEIAKIKSAQLELEKQRAKDKAAAKKAADKAAADAANA